MIALLHVSRAQTPAAVEEADETDVELAAKNFDPSMCTPPETPSAATEANLTPITWKDFDLTGKFLDRPETVRLLLAPTLERHRALTEDARADIKRAAAAFGYHVVGIGTRETPDGTHVVVHLEPLPIVRLVDVDPGLPWYGALFTRLLHDDVRRRMRTRAGAYLPWDPIERQCEIEREKERIVEFLHDEGYFDGKVSIWQKRSGTAIVIKVKLALGTSYQTDLSRITVPNIGALPVSLKEIREKFEHKGRCVLGKGANAYLCYGKPRFTRTEHQQDLQALAQMLRKKGYPAVRVSSDFAPERSIDRRTHTVRFNVSIDLRRRLELWFEGHDPNTIKQDDLRKQLTFDEAASADDVEAEASARAIAAYLQTKGYFDARVTWRKERFPFFDKLVYRIEQGKTRSVDSVDIVGNRALSEGQLREVMGTKPARLSRSLFGGSTAATSELLAGDITRIVDLYRRNGYRDARVKVTASTDRAALDSAALTAALVAANRGAGLHVRFTIDEGQPTLITQVHVELETTGDVVTDENRALCEQVLKDLAELYNHPPLAKMVTRDRCIGIATDLAFREDDAADTDDRLKDRLFTRGRPRAEVTYEPVAIGPRRIAAKYTLKNLQQLKIGKIVIRGNFRTRDSIIRGELDLAEGSLLTSDALANGARRLRNTALFDSVNIAMPDLETTGAGTVNAVVEVTERYDYRTAIQIEAGYSSFNGTFAKLTPVFPNLFGAGVSLDLSGTLGFDAGPLINEGTLQLRQLAAEANLRFPKFLVRQIGLPELQADLTAFHRRQETERFGLLRTTGATVSLSRTWERPRLGKRQARAITVGGHYDYRSRERNIDALRPVGADDDDSQVPVTTITGSLGLTAEWEQRVDRGGSLSPLAPEDGFRLEAQASVAHPWLLSQDTFIKVQAAATRYWPLGANLVLRSDLRYDQGFPLGGAALLPEVERFFAGGDSTVRGYDDERLARELIVTGVPPLSNITQIRVLPAGGNIMVLGSVDLQYRVYSVLATALFVDAGMIKNQWNTVTTDDIRPSAGMALARIVTPFGALAIEYAIPLRPQLGDDPRGRWHINFAARAQF